MGGLRDREGERGWERERGREGGRERGREREGGGEGGRERERGGGGGRERGEGAGLSIPLQTKPLGMHKTIFSFTIQLTIDTLHR